MIVQAQLPSHNWLLSFLDQQNSRSELGSEPDKKPMKVQVEILEISNDTCFVMTGSGDRSLPGIVYIDKK